MKSKKKQKFKMIVVKPDELLQIVDDKFTCKIFILYDGQFLTVTMENI